MRSSQLAIEFITGEDVANAVCQGQFRGDRVYGKDERPPVKMGPMLLLLQSSIQNASNRI